MYWNSICLYSTSRYFLLLLFTFYCNQYRKINAHNCVYVHMYYSSSPFDPNHIHSLKKYMSSTTENSPPPPILATFPKNISRPCAANIAKWRIAKSTARQHTNTSRVRHRVVNNWKSFCGGGGGWGVGRGPSSRPMSILGFSTVMFGYTLSSVSTRIARL